MKTKTKTKKKKKIAIGLKSGNLMHETTCINRFSKLMYDLQTCKCAFLGATFW